ncbi:hypothetical protein J723_1884 [Acinetobacter sp. 1264765]|nr:hypothetical protein J723_1884 [Acinetobacter sp. 1264765]
MDRHNAYIAHRCRKARETGFFNACKFLMPVKKLFLIWKYLILLNYL